MTKLSSATQCILTALNEVAWDWASMEQASPREIAAVALRATADQVTPDDYESFTGHYDWDSGSETRNNSIREALLCIANELEQLND